MATPTSVEARRLTGLTVPFLVQQARRQPPRTIEGFWSIFKRGVVGTFHKVSAKYLPLYVAEFQFRDNNRDNEDIFGEAVRGC